MSFNRVQLIGNLGAKPELKTLNSGATVCEMRVATNEKWVKDGEKHEKVEWHRVIVWGKVGESCAKYLDKGRQVFLEGKLQTRTWDDAESGQKRYMTEIVAHSVQFLGGSKVGAGPKSEEPEEVSGPSGIEDDVPF